MTSDWNERDRAAPQDQAPQEAAASKPAASKPYVSPEVLKEAAEDAVPDAQAVLAEELTGTRDKLLRTLAEMENLRRRTEREVSDARAYGISGFARDILDIADNLHRALDAIPAEARERGEASWKAFIEGVELTERALMQSLEKNGVKRFDPMGQKFDPNREQAMYEVPDPSVPAGTVVQVVQAGYMIGERVLRPALVGIAKGGPKEAKSEAGAPPGTTDGA